MAPVALITGGGTGIGAATAHRLAQDGFDVVVAGRRPEPLDATATAIRSAYPQVSARAVVMDVTDAASVAAAAEVIGGCDVLVNNAGGAFGLEPVAGADLDAWQSMFDVNVLGPTRVTKALLPALVAAEGVIVFVTSTAADLPYEGGAGYCGAKAAERSMVGALRLELFDQPVRITEICPGMVYTEEFSTKRFGGDEARAAAIYAGVPQPLVADDVADAITWMATRPSHVNVDRLTIRPRAQAAQHKVFRVGA